MTEYGQNVAGNPLKKKFPTTDSKDPFYENVLNSVLFFSIDEILYQYIDDH